MSGIERYTGQVPVIEQRPQDLAISAIMRDKPLTSMFSANEESLLQQAASESGFTFLVAAREGETYAVEDSGYSQTVGTGNIYVTVIGENKDFAGFWKRLNELRAKRK